mgnify:CR=1 FL=1|jgi:hypothetical protein
MNENEFFNYLDSVKTNEKGCLATEFLYHMRTNPATFQFFEQFSLQMIQRRPKRGSAWMVANRVRWETAMTHDEVYKVSNDFIALYARLFMARHPQHEGYFITKTMKRIFGL